MRVLPKVMENSIKAHFGAKKILKSMHRRGLQKFMKMRIMKSYAWIFKINLKKF